MRLVLLIIDFFFQLKNHVTSFFFFFLQWTFKKLPLKIKIVGFLLIALANRFGPYCFKPIIYERESNPL